MIYKNSIYDNLIINRVENNAYEESGDSEVLVES